MSPTPGLWRFDAETEAAFLEAFSLDEYLPARLVAQLPETFVFWSWNGPVRGAQLTREGKYVAQAILDRNAAQDTLRALWPVRNPAAAEPGVDLSTADLDMADRQGRRA